MIRLFALLVFISTSVHSLRGQDVVLDTLFGDNGLVLTDVGSGSDIAYGLALQPDGKIITVGTSNLDLHYHMTIVRYEPSGQLDMTFGDGGKVVLAIDTTYDWLYDVAVQPDGKIVASGGAIMDTTQVFAIIRLTATGQLDTSFGSAGVVLTPGSPEGASASANTLQPDGKILVAGNTYNSSIDIMLSRYLDDGSLDPAFGVNGIVVTDFGYDENGKAIEVKSDGKIVVAGSRYGPNWNYSVTQYLPDGTLDNSFGSGGSAVVSLTNGVDRCFALALQTDGKILLGGGTDYGEGPQYDSDFGIVRFNENGTPDVAFGSNGHTVTDVFASYDTVISLLIQPDGKILAVGFDAGGGSMSRYTYDGSLDPTFGSLGIINEWFGTYSDPYAAALQPDGKILTAGLINYGNQYSILVCRYLNDLDIGIADFKIPAPTCFSYPNPISSTASFRYALNRSGAISMEMFDANGRHAGTYLSKAMRPSGNNCEVLDLSSLAAGHYTIVLSNEEGSTSVKVVKE